MCTAVVSILTFYSFLKRKSVRHTVRQTNRQGRRATIYLTFKCYMLCNYTPGNYQTDIHIH